MYEGMSSFFRIHRVKFECVCTREWLFPRLYIHRCINCVHVAPQQRLCKHTHDPDHVRVYVRTKCRKSCTRNLLWENCVKAVKKCLMCMEIIQGIRPRGKVSIIVWSHAFQTHWVPIRTDILCAGKYTVQKLYLPSCICVCVCVCKFMHMWMWHTHIHKFCTQTHTTPLILLLHLDIYTYKCTYIHTYKCTYVRTYKRTYIHTYKCTYIHSVKMNTHRTLSCCCTWTYIRKNLHTYIV
jgi:hypothetical protein